MSTILIILVLIFLFGGGGYYAHDRYGGSGLGSALGLLLVVVVVRPWRLEFVESETLTPSQLSTTRKVCGRVSASRCDALSMSDRQGLQGLQGSHGDLWGF
jgi:hypothetical protein